LDARTSSKLDVYKSILGEGFTSANCPVRDVIAGINGRWNALIMMALSDQPHRFGQLRRLIPDISQRMLTQTLHDLQRNGYVNRKVFPTKPPSVEYSLTELGWSMFDPLYRLVQWAERNHDAVRAARAEFDRAHAA
jgi:DNA-binding HxlR family transcriptional regulator